MSDDATQRRSVAPGRNPVAASLAAMEHSWKHAREAIETADALPAAAETMASVEVGQTPSEVVYRENKLELLHYESQTAEQHQPPILVVYALINRPYILDLQPDRSVVRRLLEAGHDVYMIRWGEPSILDASLGLSDYVDRYIDNCVDCVRERAATDDVHLLGYCMGGTFSAMYAARYPEKVRTLGLMAAGLCFDGDGGVLERWGAEEHFDAGRLADVYGTVPAEFLSAGFDMMDPVQNTVRKYLTLLDSLDDPEFLENFARMERWLEDGVDVAGAVFEEFVAAVYQSNALMENDLVIDGRPVDVDAIDMPVLQIVGTYDHLIPPEASKPFTDAIPSDDTATIEFETGHVGLSVSSRSHAELWPEVAAWFGERSDSGDGSRASPDDAPEGQAAGDGSTGTEPPSTAAASQTGAAPSNGASEDATPPADTAREPPEVDDPASDGPASAEGGVERLVGAIDGVGPTYAERLVESGFDTVAAIARADRDALVAAADAPASRVDRWIEQARSGR